MKINTDKEVVINDNSTLNDHKPEGRDIKIEIILFYFTVIILSV